MNDHCDEIQSKNAGVRQRREARGARNCLGVAEKCRSFPHTCRRRKMREDGRRGGGTLLGKITIIRASFGPTSNIQHLILPVVVPQQELSNPFNWTGCGFSNPIVFGFFSTWVTRSWTYVQPNTTRKLVNVRSWRPLKKICN
jgi:hypothetical protein